MNLAVGLGLLLPPHCVAWKHGAVVEGETQGRHKKGNVCWPTSGASLLSELKLKAVNSHESGRNQETGLTAGI